MQCLSPGSVFDLTPATGAVGDDECVLIGRHHRREQGQSPHLHRYVVVLGLVAE